MEYPTRPVENEQAAAEWLWRRIREAISDTERRYGVYIATPTPARVDSSGDCASVHLHANVWPAAMRIVEPELESRALG